MKIIENLKNIWGRLGEVDCPEEADAVAVLPKELIESLDRVDEMAGKFNTFNSNKSGKSGKGKSSIVKTVTISPEAVKQMQAIKDTKQTVSKGNTAKEIGE